MILEMKETCSTAMKVNLRCTQRAKISDKFRVDASSSRENSPLRLWGEQWWWSSGYWIWWKSGKSCLPKAEGPQQAPLLCPIAWGTTPCDIPFTRNSRVQVQTVGFEPYNFFALVITNGLLNCFVTKTNCYAVQFLAENNLTRRSHANDWYPTDMKEIKQFLGLFFLIGILLWYTCTGPKIPCFVLPFTVQFLSGNYFQLLLKFPHFNDNSYHLINSSSWDLYWITSEKFQEVYEPSCNISTAESLFLWKGRLFSNNASHWRELDLEWNTSCCVRIVDTHFHSKSTLVKKMWPQQYKTSPFLRELLLTNGNNQVVPRARQMWLQKGMLWRMWLSQS